MSRPSILVVPRPLPRLRHRRVSVFAPGAAPPPRPRGPPVLTLGIAPPAAGPVAAPPSPPLLLYRAPKRCAQLPRLTGPSALLLRRPPPPASATRRPRACPGVCRGLPLGLPPRRQGAPPPPPRAACATGAVLARRPSFSGAGTALSPRVSLGPPPPPPRASSAAARLAGSARRHLLKADLGLPGSHPRRDGRRSPQVPAPADAPHQRYGWTPAMAAAALLLPECMLSRPCILVVSRPLPRLLRPSFSLSRPPTPASLPPRPSQSSNTAQCCRQPGDKRSSQQAPSFPPPSTVFTVSTSTSS
ncbi:hypothetical protein BS78_03G147400 [Paspalum vaginatum]|nr:hypothetical protein BS78_03G147400 [Paspalum vaginatum]